MRLHTKILIGLIFGALAGFGANVSGVPWLRNAMLALEPIGTIFISLITMIVLPLVVASLLVGIATLGDTERLGRIGGKTIVFFLTTTIIAATIGLVLGWTTQPGMSMDPAARDALASQFGSATAGTSTSTETAPGIIETMVNMVPRNPVQAAAELELLPLIIFTLIFGAALSLAPPRQRDTIITFFEAINSASMVVIGWVMRLAPYAVFAILAAVVARFGLDVLRALLFYSLVVVVGLLFQAFGTFAVALRLLARTNIFSFYGRIAEAALVAFSTSSSNATLPVTMEVAERNLGISKSVIGFVLPLGATLNMNGSALYKAVTVLFIAQVYSVPMGAAELFAIVVTSTLAAVAGAGVPGSSLVTTLIVLNAAGLGAQAEVGIALVLGMDRILDMMRTTVNVTGDLVCCAYIARSEGEELISRPTAEVQAAELIAEGEPQLPITAGEESKVAAEQEHRGTERR